MPAVLYLLICFLAGWQIKKFSRIDTAALFRRIAGDTPGTAVLPPAWTFDIPFALITGTTAVTTLHYFLAYASHFALSGTHISSLLPPNLLVFAAAAAAAAVFLIRRIPRTVRAEKPLRSAVSGLSAYFADSPKIYALSLWFFGLFATFLIFYGFFVKGGVLYSGYTVFSDFAPHTAVISSFAYGDNFPTGYPHFAGDGIRYHFFFFYLCANLLTLGMRFDFAMNVPSILGILSFTTLLGSFGVLLTRRRPVFFLAPFMLFFRSSYAIFDYLRELASEKGATFLSVLRGIADTNKFIGSTLHDDWGLWAMNVYANQRHFLWGMSILLIVLFLLFPTVRRRTGAAGEEAGTAGGTASVRAGGAARFTASLRRYLIAPERWTIREIRPLVPAAALTACLAYWHGSVLIALLLILFTMAFFAYERLAYLLIAASGVAASFLLSAFFSGGAGNVVSPSFYWGFLAEDKTLTGVGTYLFKVIGITLLLILIIPFVTERRDVRVFALAAAVPGIFALTVSLTPDVTVNHKYIIIALSLLNICIAGIYCDLWDAVRRLRRTRAAAAVLAGALAVFIGFALFATGAVELIGYTNKNRNSVTIDLKSPLTEWLKENTDPEDVFLTAPYHMNAFFFSGRKVFYGWPYYTMTAGHDTASRLRIVRDLFEGCGGDKDLFLRTAKQYGIRYAIIDNTLLYDSGYEVDKGFFSRNFTVAATFPQIGNAVIYKLYD